jgi:pSer/pThr/pTyr-binding forkhead associated (FHA) protein
VDSRVVVVSGSAKGTVVRLTGSQFFVGRDSSNQLCLQDRAVSRKHFSISETDAAFHLVDLDSRNGTLRERHTGPAKAAGSWRHDPGWPL